MSFTTHELVSKLAGVQNQVWQTVSLTVSESTAQSVNFAPDATEIVKPADLLAGAGTPMLVIQFGLASLPDNAHLILIPRESLIEFAGLAKGEPVADVDENLVADIRPALESIVQGICLAMGNINGEPVVASGLSIRFQELSLPPNLESAEEILRTEATISAESFSKPAYWALDPSSAQMMLGLSAQVLADNVIVGSFGESGNAGSKAEQSGRPDGAGDSHGLDLLMDIPLEISVELGRVKMVVREVVDLGTGSIIEIDKAAGDPVDVLVNGRIVARGEVVVIEDNFGVRITEILNPQERLNRLSEVA